LRAVLHDEAGGHRAGARDRQAVRRAERRPARDRQPARCRHDRARQPADRARGVNGSTVLIVDDARTLARAIKAFLTEAGYEAEVAGDAEQALRLLETMRPDVVFSDVRLPGMDGIELLRRVREFDPAIPVIIMPAHGTIE